MFFNSSASFQLSERARERKVPVTRLGRLANFGGTVTQDSIFRMSKFICKENILVILLNRPKTILISSTELAAQPLIVTRS